MSLGHNKSRRGIHMSSLPFFLGHGYRSYLGTIGQRVIDHSQLKDPIVPGDARVESQFGVVASREEFELAFSADASLSGSYGAFSAEAKASFSRQYARSATRVSIAFTKRVIKGIYRIAEFPVTSEANRTARNPSRFLLAYGDELITGVGVGGACCYLFQFGFNSEREATEFKIAIGASYGTSSGSYSQHQKTVISKVKASVSFSGYSTGTIRVPNLFPAELQEGTKFLFSAGFSDSMIGGLLDYFDSFQDMFSEEDKEQFSQTLMSRDSYLYLPDTFRNQDEIVEKGNAAQEISIALSSQLSIIDASMMQLEYMMGLEEFNLATSLTEAREMLSALSATRAKVENRGKSLRTGLDTKSPFDFRAEIPAIPAYFCTADPDDRTYTKTPPFRRWGTYDFPINSADFDKVCRVEAIGSISTVRHRPNGGSATLQLTRIALPKRRHRDLSTYNLDGFATRSRVNVVEEKELSAPHRPLSDSAAVGGFTFVPSRGHFYQVRMKCEGDMRGKPRIKVKTQVGRQIRL